MSRFLHSQRAYLSRLTHCLAHPSLATIAILIVGISSSLTVEAREKPELLPKLRATSAAAVAAEIDSMVTTSLNELGVEPTGPASDEDFLRRISLDLAGRIPTPHDVTLFGLTPGDEKRTQAIDRLLDSDEFGKTWAAYWRETIYSRATEVRSRLSQPVFEDWMTEQLNSGQSWSEITTDMITASGSTLEQGATGLIFAQGGDATEIAAEVSRIFMGIQIQCANCHDHPYDQWKREDFHELAAFFPRIRMRRDQDTKPATYYIESADSERDNRGRTINVDQIFRFIDRNRDGKLTKVEAERNRQFGQRFARMIEMGDKDGDGAVSLAELKELPRPSANRPGRGSAEYYMPDLENPAEPGTRTEPVFFVNNRKVSFGTDDLDRRGTLAKYITSPLNPWFAKAFVNRMWGEMLGEGFYSPIDDMGPQHVATNEDILNLLAAGFIARKYDVKWVYRTIALTDVYQRSAPSGDVGDSLPALAAATPTRLRGDQLYNAVTQVTGIESLGRFARSNDRRAMRYASNKDPGRAAFGQLFNYDPSTPQVDLMGNIPQALFMMNSAITSSAINARTDTALGRILKQYDNDEDALSELYLRVFAREPTAPETHICLEHIADTKDRPQAFEDIMWTLMNSTEFLTKR